MKTIRPFLFITILVVVVSLACNAVTASEPVTQPVEETQPQQQEQQTEQEQTQQEPPASAGGSAFFTEEFDSDPQWYYEVIQDNEDSDPESVTTEFSNGRMIFDIPEAFLYAYYIYDAQTYENVRTEIKVENRGVNSQQVSLICNFSDDGWYELAIQSDGLWYLFAVSEGYSRLTNGGSNDINQGKDVNEYAMECKGNEIAFFINGEEQKGSPYIDREYGLRAGSVGFSISALRAVPVNIEVDHFIISEP